MTRTHNLKAAKVSTFHCHRLLSIVMYWEPRKDKGLGAKYGELKLDWEQRKLQRRKVIWMEIHKTDEKENFKFGMGNLYTEELLVDDGERVEFWYNLWLALTVLV